MKFILKKNQIIITILAALIAVAGYLNYVDNNAKQAVKIVNTTGQGERTTEIDEGTIDLSDISDSDIQASENAATGEKTNEAAENNVAAGEDVTKSGEDILSNDTDIVSEPGQAIIVSGTSNVNFAVTARLSREQIRATNKELLMTIINNENITEEEKKEVIQQLITLTGNAEKENAAETLLQAKGYENAVVTITNENVDVVIEEGELTDVQRAQIEDVVKRKTEVSADKITITTVSK